MPNPYLRPSWWTVALLCAALVLCGWTVLAQNRTIAEQKALIRGLWSDVYLCRGFCKPKPPANCTDITRQQ